MSLEYDRIIHLLENMEQMLTKRLDRLEEKMDGKAGYNDLDRIERQLILKANKDELQNIEKKIIEINVQKLSKKEFNEVKRAYMIIKTLVITALIGAILSIIIPNAST